MKMKVQKMWIIRFSKISISIEPDKWNTSVSKDGLGVIDRDTHVQSLIAKRVSLEGGGHMMKSLGIRIKRNYTCKRFINLLNIESC